MFVGESLAALMVGYCSRRQDMKFGSSSHVNCGTAEGKLEE
jgi:hypothetical protein